MAAEQSTSIATEGRSSSPNGSPTRSPKHKKRVIHFEQTVPSNYDASHSGEIRKIFLEPLLHYQGFIISGSRPTKLPVEQIRELKKIACPANDLNKIYKSKTDEVDDVTGKYHQLKTVLQQFIALPQSAEGELISAIQKIYSDFIRACAEQAEKTRAASVLQAQRFEKDAEELADKQMLIDGKKHLHDTIAARKIHLSAKLQLLREHTDKDPNYQQLLSLLSRLEQRHRDAIRQITVDLPLDIAQLQQYVNRAIETQKSAIYAEMDAIEQIEKDIDNLAITEIALHTLKYSKALTSINDEVTHHIDKLSIQFHALIPVIARKINENNQAINDSAARISDLSYQLKRKYEHRKQDQDSSLDNLNRQFVSVHGKKCFNKIKNMFNQVILPSDHVMQETAASLAKRWYDNVPFINFLPPIKKAYSARKNALFKSAWHMRRSRSLHDAYAVIAENIPERIDKNHDTIHFTKINTAISVLEANNLVVLSQDKAEIDTLRKEVHQFQTKVNECSTLAQVGDKLQENVKPTVASHLNRPI
jgi:hypothetical protein